ncbi:MAG: uracil-DNA glycosylase, partial [Pseudomonadota bacterium]|nr:uracil-DNA glycosylase [Pseudomonadota bacterium]
MGQRAAYLAALGVPDWRQRRAMAVQPAARAPAAPALPDPPVGADACGNDSWDAVSTEVAGCT